MNIGKHARGLAAALVLGGAVLGLSTGQAEAKPRHPADNGVRCWTHNPGTGEWEAYLPGDTVMDMIARKKGTCGADGNWHWSAMTGPGTQTSAGTGAGGGVLWHP